MKATGTILEQVEVVFVQHWEWTEGPWVIHFQMANFVLCEFHFNKLFFKAGLGGSHL